MVRQKRYETSSDAARERKVASKFAQALSKKYGSSGGPRFGSIKARPGAPFDYYITGEESGHHKKSKAKLLLEVKCRKNESKKWPTYLISAQKIILLKSIGAGAGIKAGLAVQFTDGIFFFDISSADLTSIPIEIAGRTDRKDELDLEPCFMIPISMFKKVC
jgi:hypothetical protein